MVIQLLAPVSESPDNTWYNKEYFSGNGGSANTAGISGLITIPFSEAGLAWIQKEDYTKLGVRSSKDIAGVAPTGLEYFTYSGYVHYNIIYTAVPAVTTTKADEVDDNSANIYYTLTDDHDDAHCDKRGVCYNKTGNPTVADDKVEIEGNFSEISNYITAITGLDPGTKYYFRPYCHNPTGYGYGAEDDFTTTITAGVTTEAATQVGIDHAKGNGTTVINGASLTERGFEVKLTFSGTLGEAINYSIAGFEGSFSYNINAGKWEAALVKTITETGSFSEGAYTGDLGRFPIAVASNKLFADETYNYRARATINETVYYGAWVEFTTSGYPSGEGADGDAVGPGVPIVEPIGDEVYSPFPSDDPSYDIPSFGLPEIGFPPWVFFPWESLPWEYPPFEYSPWEFPELTYPPWEDPVFDWTPEPGIDPDISFGRMFSAYMRRLDTKKDWKTLREKCIIYQENMNQLTLTINHNVLVLKYLICDIIKYIDGDVYPSDLERTNSTQQLTPLYLEPITPNGFKDIINDFRSKDVCNVHTLNANFKKILNSLNSLYESDYSIKPISYNTSDYIDIQPTAKRMILHLGDMNKKSKDVRRLITRNIKRIFTYI